jgi:hypothetical protein
MGLAGGIIDPGGSRGKETTSFNCPRSEASEFASIGDA